MQAAARIRRVAIFLLLLGAVALLATFPFTYGDGGSRGKDTGVGVIGWLSVGGLASLLGGGCLFGLSAVIRRRQADR